jgi:CheY-like chemotaxis protein
LNRSRSFLESFGHTVLLTTSGGKGLVLATLHAIDIVIVDYLMPEMNGHEFVTKMKLLNPRAPIIMLSAALNIPQKTLALVDAFIAKNSLASELLPTIATLHGCRSVPDVTPELLRARVVTVPATSLIYCSLRGASFLQVLLKARKRWRPGTLFIQRFAGLYGWFDTSLRTGSRVLGS